MKIEAGNKYGYLTAIRFNGKNKSGHTQWLCKCDCGKMHVVDSHKLTSGHTKSCGCKHGELISKSKTRHGLSDTQIHIEWQGIRHRCYYPKNNSYKYYGERGITVCDEWNKSFESFYDYVSKLENFGKESYTLDRIDNDKGYEPGNVRWASKATQARNRRNIKRYNYNGKEYCIAELAEISGIKYASIHRRLKKGWTIERAMNTPTTRTSY